MQATAIPDDVDSLVERVWLGTLKAPASPYQMLTHAIMSDRRARPVDVARIQDAVAASLRGRMREQIAREWLAHLDDVRDRDRDSADRIFADAAAGGHLCWDEPAPAAGRFSCSACIVEDAYAFADACLSPACAARSD